jgi:hypothetical protein
MEILSPKFQSKNLIWLPIPILLTLALGWPLGDLIQEFSIYGLFTNIVLLLIIGWMDFLFLTSIFPPKVAKANLTKNGLKFSFKKMFESKWRLLCDIDFSETKVIEIVPSTKKIEVVVGSRGLFAPYHTKVEEFNINYQTVSTKYDYPLVGWSRESLQDLVNKFNSQDPKNTNLI